MKSKSWTLIESVLAGSEAIIALGITLEEMDGDTETIVLKMTKRAELDDQGRLCAVGRGTYSSMVG